MDTAAPPTHTRKSKDAQLQGSLAVQLEEGDSKHATHCSPQSVLPSLLYRLSNALPSGPTTEKIEPKKSLVGGTISDPTSTYEIYKVKILDFV